MRGDDAIGRVKALVRVSARRAFFVFSLVAIATVAGVSGYFHGRGKPPAFVESIDISATQRVVDLERQLADIKLGQVVDGDANQSLRQTIKSLRDELSSAQEEVQFYRRLMTPTEVKRGIQVEKLELSGTDNPAEVSYRLLLARFEERAGLTSGLMTIDIAGTSKSGQEVLPLTDLSEVESYPLPFRFRYFQEFNGSLTVPEGFKPQEITVTVATAGKNATRVQKTFAWAMEAE